jgi:hypothetical protein
VFVTWPKRTRRQSVLFGRNRARGGGSKAWLMTCERQGCERNNESLYAWDTPRRGHMSQRAPDLIGRSVVTSDTGAKLWASWYGRVG